MGGSVVASIIAHGCIREICGICWLIVVNGISFVRLIGRSVSAEKARGDGFVVSWSALAWVAIIAWSIESQILRVAQDDKGYTGVVGEMG